ncbi:hypothetical protein [Sphingomonas sp. CARO-RG-8B-R24-01]|uniref:hypothetical protein n=1 Tax=Sphingomonas sp. CARO-RG-8B-R24-01 TaxID=2914831 RepID=UPI001F57E9F1|nr:hypothetical protein [Sphingomonas sp. CARO-RG-8B-R24-01]
MKAAQRHGHGRPLRFLAAVAAGWIGVRTIALWPGYAVTAPPNRAVAARLRPVMALMARVSRDGLPPESVPGRPGGIAPDALAIRATPALLLLGGRMIAPPAAAAAEPLLPAGNAPGDRTPLTVPPFVAGRPFRPGGSARAPRWSGSAWLVGRAGIAPAGAPVGGELGGSQAGIRLVRTLDRRGRLALAARLTTPLGAGLREAALGLEWQPTRLPLRLVVQRRFTIGGGRGGPEAGLVGGFGPLRIGRGLLAEGYGQAGVIQRAIAEPYADAAARLTRTAGRVADAPIDLGVGVWGGAQRGVERFDIGPTMAIHVPVATHAVRLTLDWRERIGGRAKPGSGPALTLGTDF